MEIRDEIMTRLDRLPPDLQQRVLEFVSSLDPPSGPKGMSGAEFVRRFSGLLDAQSAHEMMEAIESDCERIDEDGW